MLRHSNHDGTVTTLCFSPDGRFLASGSTDGRVFLWEPGFAEARRLPLPPEDRDYPISSLAFHPVGTLLGVGRSIPRDLPGRNDAVGVWELPEATRFHAAPHTVGLYPALTFVGDTGILLAHSISHPRGGYFGARIDRWTLPEWDDHHEHMSARGARGTWIAVRGQRVATGSGDFATIQVRNWTTNGYIAGIYYADRLKGLDWHPDRTELIFATPAVLCASVPNSGRIIRLPTPEGPPLNCMAFSVDGTRLALGRKQGRIDVLATDDWRLLSSVTWRIGDIRSIAFAPDGLRLAVGTGRGLVVVWDAE